LRLVDNVGNFFSAFVKRLKQIQAQVNLNAVEAVGK
jgi:hypothetical protein